MKLLVLVLIVQLCTQLKQIVLRKKQFIVYRKPPARRVVPKSLRLYTPVESRNPLIKFAKRSDHLHNK